MKGTPRPQKRYPVSKTIPGQSLKPAELLKRHLAGTLPDIDRSSRYEFHFDEDGVQHSAPLPLEMHELYKLADKVRKEQEQAAIAKRKKDAEEFKDKLIKRYEAEKAAKAALTSTPGKDSAEPPRSAGAEPAQA